MTVIHHTRVHRSDENLEREGQLAWRIAEVATDPVEVRARGRRHDHQPDHRQRRRGRGIPHPRAGQRRPPAGARPRGVDRRPGLDRLRLPARAAHQPGVGGLGERCRRARTRLPRHLPRRRVLAPRRQHPADPRGGPACRGSTARRSCAASRPGTRSRSTSCARSACTSTRSTTSPTSAPRPRPASAPSSDSTSRRSTRRSARRCTPPRRRGSRARARSRRGRRTLRRSRARWRSRRSTARCAARPRRAPSTKAKTA